MPDFVLCWETFSLLFPSGKSFLFISSKSAVYQMLANFRHWGEFFAVFEHFWGEVGGGQRRESCITFTPYLNFFNYSLPSCKWVCKLCVRIAYHHEMMLWLCSWWAGDSATSLNYYLDFSTALNPVPYYSLIRVWQLAVISVTPFISCCSLASYIYLS